jgi:hypothetical protein
MKDKGRNKAKQNQKRALKATQRRAEIKKRPPKQAVPMGRKFTFASKEEFDFWRADGVNFILSDYENATWMPMFDIYNGGTPPDLNAVAKSVMEKFGPDTGDWPDEGRAALGWAVNPPQTLAIYYMEAQRRLKEQNPEEDISVLIRTEHNPVVWGVFNYIKTEIANRTV